MSSTSTYSYETVYILRPGTSETDATAIHQKVDTVISKFQGAVKTRDDLGIQPLCYEIQDEHSGKINLVVYNGTSGVVEEIERHFKISSNVIRFLTVMVAKDYDYALVKKQIALAEEEMKKARELRKKGQ